ncbi:hypothetical protein AWJ20_1997 [Sugiyamaella lignohabitans]|uniref:Mediator of RNA polymerase II transcription subunit 20 n=1 Tax=Sugiyamaella lignohabitans TaxID=796027 RepID=A0A167ESN6_9ASCO|nr:uncharacterized protein AWJ20_1997 [Sugiyamaella lignohabitans]ANB14409.1 hypothetical protein AWJ20_1997 [Sugiyamaella lignohabitans]
MLTTKLQSLWLLRQVIQGEGHSYELQGGKFILRLANIFLQGSYKGLLVQVEYNSSGSEDTSGQIQKINEFLAQYGLKFVGNKLAKDEIGTAWQYVDALSR